MLKISQLNFSFHHKLIFQDLNLALSPKQKVVLVGPNGKGKSTLLKLVLGKLEPDSGDIYIDKKTTIGYLPQLTDLEVPLGSLVLNSTQKHLFEKSLAKLGAAGVDYGRLVSEYSGGEQIKLLIALATANSPNLLLLDEPTNHLDISARKWLIQYLKEFSGSVICISHDREFIDGFADSIFELRKNQLYKYVGNYEQYEDQKQKETEGAEARNRSSLAKKKKLIENWKKRAVRAKATIRKVPKDKDKMGFDYRAEKAMETHVKALRQLERQINDTKLEDVELPQTIVMKNHASLPDQYLLLNWEGKQVSRYPVTIYVGSFKIYSRDHVLLQGPNGSGKSTLLSEVVKEFGQQSGERSVALIDQGDPLANSKQRVVEYFEEQAGVNEGAARGYLHRLLLSKEEAALPLNRLSPGQRLRIRLCILVIDEPDLLLLDEPTNHLDVASVLVVQKLLSEYRKAYIVVSHDQKFVEVIKISKSYTINNNELVEEYL